MASTCKPTRCENPHHYRRGNLVSHVILDVNRPTAIVRIPQTALLRGWTARKFNQQCTGRVPIMSNANRPTSVVRIPQTALFSEWTVRKFNQRCTGTVLLLYSGELWSDLWPACPSSWLRFFVITSSLSKQIPERYFETGHNRFVPRPHVLTIFITPFNSAVCNTLHLKQRL
jgi:hypothetical protein